MGGGASVPDQDSEELTEKQKAGLLNHLEEQAKKVKDEVTRRASLDDNQRAAHVFEHLKSEYVKQVAPLKQALGKGSAEAEVDAQNGAAVVAPGDGFHPTVSPKSQHEFRRRRLTFASQKAMSSNKLPVSGNNFGFYKFFQSGEIGELREQGAPLPKEVLGTFSCHGMEPSWDEGNSDGKSEVSAKINQDRGCVVCPFLGSPTSMLCCVFDGHGEKGDVVSNFVMEQMAPRLCTHAAIASDPAQALRETFMGINKDLETLADADVLYSGTTGVVTLVIDSRMYVANAGDSRAIMATKTSDPHAPLAITPLSNDHNPDRPTEMKRIIKAGGFISPPPEPGLSARVWLDKEMTQVGLAMARSIGDHAVKDVGVVAEPEVTVRDVSARDAFFVMASDGVFEFLQNDEVVKLVDDAISTNGGNVEGACELLIGEAARRWRENEGTYRDDITAVIVKFPCFHLEELGEREGAEGAGGGVGGGEGGGGGGDGGKGKEAG